nr:MAG TPA: hypothetical protein [Caudoviricetes sp.]
MTQRLLPRNSRQISEIHTTFRMVVPDVSA